MKSERLMLALGTIIGVVGLLIFGRHVWNASAPGADPPGITIKSEILMVYAPKALIDFARAHPGITTNDELVRLTQQAKLHVWFATITWNYQANGVVADIPICYLPGEKPECFEVAADVLRTRRHSARARCRGLQAAEDCDYRGRDDGTRARGWAQASAESLKTDRHSLGLPRAEEATQSSLVPESE